MNAQVHTAASGEKSNHSFLITQLVLEYSPNTKVTHRLSTSKHISLHSSKWKKEQPFIPNHTSCVRMLSKNKSNFNYLLSTSECTSSHSSKWRKERPFILNPTFCVSMLSKYKSNFNYLLSTSECTSSQSSKWRKEQPFILSKTINMTVTHHLITNAQVNTTASGEKRNRSFLITHLVLEC